MKNPRASRADEIQVGGDHYKEAGPDMQHWNMVIVHNLDYFGAQITRYLFRWKDKGGLEDLEKAQHYLNKYVEVAKAAANGHSIYQRFLNWPKEPPNGHSTRTK